MKNLLITTCLFSALAINSSLAADTPQPNQPVQQIQSQPSLSNKMTNSTTGPTSTDFPNAASAPVPTGEGARNQPTPNQQSQQPPVLSNAMSIEPTPPALPPATPLAPPSAPQTPPMPDHSDAPQDAQLPANAKLPEPPNPEVTKMKVSAQKNLDSMGHSIGSQIRSCWKIPKSAIGGAPLTAIIYIDKQGVLSFSGFTTTPTDKQAELVASIKTAIAECSPLKSLPPEAKYEEWKSMLLKFNPNRRKAVKK